jgi:DNA-binding MarR family transcriptional regulator
MYDEALRPIDMRGTQFTILQAFSRTGEIPQKLLGQVLAMDSTTLTRTLGILISQGWIAERRGGDRRERLLSLTREGRDQFNRALPLWERAQQRMRTHLGDQRWGEFIGVINEVAAHAIHETANSGGVL